MVSVVLSDFWEAISRKGGIELLLLLDSLCMQTKETKLTTHNH